MAMHSRKGANLRHRRGGALLPNTREQGGESLPSLAVSTQNNHQEADQEADQDQEVDQVVDVCAGSGGRCDAEVSTAAGCTGM